MWSAIAPSDVEESAPSARSKHTATLIGENVYLLGGRNGNLPTKDFWKYNIVTGKWQLLTPSGDKLPSLQEHSAVAYKDRIYIFGGEVGFSAGTETPLWSYDIKENSWRKIRSKKGVAAPKGRRGHTALIHRGYMIVYGGYQDLRGSCSELWAFHFETESWHLLSTTSGKSTPTDVLPPSRHKHSAIMHEECMWIYGGMTDLQERSDFWKWDTVLKKWSLIKTKINPGPLHSHAVCKLPSSMILFGGERNGHPTNELWKFHFDTEMWEKIIISGVKPQPRSESVAFSISEVCLHSSPRLKTKTSNRHSSYLPNNKIAPCEKTYVFQPSKSNYTDGSDPQTDEKTNRKLLQEITRISRLNNKCNYTVLTSGCTTDSTESLLKRYATPPPTEEEPSDFHRNTLVKSKSAYVIKKKYNVEEKITREPISVPNFATLTPSLTPVEATKLVYLDVEEEKEILGESVKPPKRGESYSSHLGYADNPLYQHMMKIQPDRENLTTSDYASIETMNRLSTNSNYSIKTTENSEKKDGPYGFCNPNYLGPDIEALLNNEKKEESEDVLELQDFPKETKVYFRNPVRNYPDLPTKNESKRRAHSAGRVERTIDDDFDRICIPLYIYVIGGKEYGQVTIFQRPISMWKLKLF